MYMGDCGDDSTCGSCDTTMDYTAATGGMYYCDNDYFYVDEDLDGNPEAGPNYAPGCYYDDECDGGDGDGDDDDDCSDDDNGFQNVYCDDGNVIFQDDCGDDSTCGDCDGAVDYTEATYGAYSCDDDTGMYYVDSDLDGSIDQSGYLPGCHYNSCSDDDADDDDDHQCVDSDWTYKGRSSKDCDW